MAAAGKVGRGYRFYSGDSVVYPFGSGLSYSTFSWSALVATSTGAVDRIRTAFFGCVILLRTTIVSHCQDRLGTKLRKPQTRRRFSAGVVCTLTNTGKKTPLLHHLFTTVAL